MSSLEIRSVVVFIVMEREAPVVALELQVLSYLNSFMLNTVHHKRKVSRPRYASERHPLRSPMDGGRVQFSGLGLMT
jgi:hypothetical protein